MTTRNPPWSDSENSALVALYFAMLDMALAGKTYNKAGMVRAAQNGMGPRQLETMHAHELFLGKLNNRSRGSIEAKLMNASAAHHDLNPEAETMHGHGYRALSNYQAALSHAMLHALQNRVLLTERKRYAGTQFESD